MASVFHLLKYGSLSIRLLGTLLMLIFLTNILISLHMHAKLPFIIAEDDISLQAITHILNPTAQLIYRRQDHLYSLFNPVVIYKYISQDWTTLLDIPPLIKECTFINTKLFAGLRFVSMISNASFPLLPSRNELPKHLLTLNKVSKLRLQTLFIVLLTSTRTTKRYDAARKSWIKHLTYDKVEDHICNLSISETCVEYFRCCLNISKSRSAKMIVVGDELDYNRGIITMPELKHKNSYLDAQHRQLKIMKYIVRNCRNEFSDKCLLKDVHWIALIDDDTWLNVYQTINILSLFDWNRPIVVGHILTQQESNKDLLYVSGGAGIFLSKPAFLAIASRLYSTCPFCKYNDVTIGACSAILNIERVHIPLFLAFRPTNLIPFILSSVATIHYMSPDDMLNGTISLTTSI